MKKPVRLEVRSPNEPNRQYPPVGTRHAVSLRNWRAVRPDRQGGFAGHVRIALLTIVLFSIPWGISLWLREQLHHRSIRAGQDVVRADLEQILAHIQRLAQQQTYIQDRLERFVRALRWSRRGAADIGRGLLPYGSLFLFDAQGKRISLAGTTPGFALVSEQGLALLRKPRHAAQTFSRGSRRMVERVIGTGEVLALLAERQGQIVDLGRLGFSRLAGYVPCRLGRTGRGFVLGIFERSRLDQFGLVRSAVERIARLTGPDYTIRLKDLGGTPSAGMQQASDAALHEEMALTDGVEKGGTAVRGAVIDRRYLVSVSHSLPEPGSWIVQNHGNIFLGTVVCLIGVLGLLHGLRRRGLAIRTQILLLFGLAALGGIGALIGLAGSYLKLREETMIRQSRREALNILSRADQAFPAFLARLTRRFNQVADSLDGFQGADDVNRRINRISPRWKRWLNVLVFAPDGTILARLAGDEPGQPIATMDESREKFFSDLAKDTLEAWVWRQQNPGGNLPERLLNGSPIQSVVVRNQLDEIGRINRLAIGSFGLNSFTRIISDHHGTRNVFQIFLNGGVDQRVFLGILRRQWRASTFPASFSFRIFGLPRYDQAMWDSSAKRRTDGDLMRFHSLLETIPSTHAMIGKMGGREWQFVGRPGTQMTDSHLVLGFPTKPVREASNRLGRAFLALGGMLLLFALLVGTLFAETILKPLQAIFNALQWLSRSDFSRRVRLESGDDLQKIGEGLNELFDEMEERAAADVIQQQLLPSAPTILDEIVIFGHSFTAEHHNGDLFEILPTPDGATIGVILSLSRRTVASALIAGGVKTHLRFREYSAEAPLCDLVTELWAVIPPEDREDDGAHVLVARCHPDRPELKVAWRGNFVSATADSGQPPVDLAKLTIPQKAGVVGEISLAIPPDTTLFLATADSMASGPRPNGSRKMSSALFPALSPESSSKSTSELNSELSPELTSEVPLKMTCKMTSKITSELSSGLSFEIGTYLSFARRGVA